MLHRIATAVVAHMPYDLQQALLHWSHTGCLPRPTIAKLESRGLLRIDIYGSPVLTPEGAAALRIIRNSRTTH